MVVLDDLHRVDDGAFFEFLAQVLERLGPHARFVLDTFGPERCLFGSNFPMDAVSAPYGYWLATLGKTLDDAGLGAAAKQAVLFDNARRFYRL